jgi:hypothetical protein
MPVLTLNITNIVPNEFRIHGNTIYADFIVELARPDGVEVIPRSQAWQFDLARYPEMKTHIDALLPLLTSAYLFEAQMAADPGQAYTPPPPVEPVPQV